jgi:hypothetical protein
MLFSTGGPMELIHPTPVKFRAEVQYAIVSPQYYGTKWTFLFRIAPVISSPFS